MGKRKVIKKRQPRMPSVDTPGEREQAVALFRAAVARSGLPAMFKERPPFPDAIQWPGDIREAFPLIDLVRPLPENLLWSTRLPDFPAAVSTAERAAATHYACLPGIREVLA